MKLGHVAAGAIAAVLASTSAHAHFYWIMPEDFHVRSEEHHDHIYRNYIASLEFGSGDQFFVSDKHAFNDATPYNIVATNPEGKFQALTSLHLGTIRGIGELDLAREGTYVITVSQNFEPRYFSQLRNSKTGETRWVDTAKTRAAGPDEEVVKGGAYYYGHKTILSRDALTDNWRKPTNLVLDIIPGSHPQTIRQGDQVEVTVLFEGKPQPDVTVKAIHEGFVPPEEDQPYAGGKTGSDGTFTFTADKPGPWLIAAYHRFSVEGNPDADYVDYSTYYTFDFAEE